MTIKEHFGTFEEHIENFFDKPNEQEAKRFVLVLHDYYKANIREKIINAGIPYPFNEILLKDLGLDNDI